MSELPDLRASGFTRDDLDGRGMLGGEVDGKRVVVIAVGEDLYALGAACTHYHGNLDQGIFDGTHVRCPLHHARFDVTTGEPRSPALNPVATYQVEQREGRWFVGEQREAPPPEPVQGPGRVVIVGGGAAGYATAHHLRRRGFDGEIVMVSNDTRPPYDRPNVSKDYLAGEAPPEWMPLAEDDDYQRRRIDLHIARTVSAIDPAMRHVELDTEDVITYDTLVLATGAEPVKLAVPGSDGEQVHLLRTMDDADAIIRASEQAQSAVVVGAGFIGLEAAAALRKRGLEVHVVTRDAEPLLRVMGPEVGSAIRADHEANGVVFHLECSVTSIEPGSVVLEDGARLPADLVLVGIGVRPRTHLAEGAGLAVDDGVIVDEHLRTSDPSILAAGDAARFPYKGERVRIEHWVVAERHGETVAASILGDDRPFADAPFFWSVHFDARIRYVGHGAEFDEVTVSGDPAAHDAAVFYRRAGRIIAVATMGRDRVALEAEVAFERDDQRALEQLAAP